MKNFKLLIQGFLPQHLLSRFFGFLGNYCLPLITHNYMARYIKQHRINMQEAAEENYLAYKTFNAFFTRRLKPGARPLAGDETTVVSPADGTISEIGDIEKDLLLQAKGIHYDLKTLLAGQTKWVDAFQNGKFATIYLSPGDYHRVHMPLKGKLLEMHHVPGRLFSVDTATTQSLDGLFVRNERAVCLFETDQGPMAVIMVGAMLVASIHTVWAGKLGAAKRLRSIDYTEKNVFLERGAEMGHFELGSTVIMLFPQGRISWPAHLSAETSIKMGELLAKSSAQIT